MASNFSAEALLKDPVVIVEVLFGTLISYAVGLYIYRIYFHPLRNFPGPKTWAYSPVPGIRALLKGGLFREYKHIHEKYGAAVRVGPNELSFNSAQAWEDIYGHRIGHANMHKDPIHVGSVEPLAGVTTLTMADDDNHARQRRALAHSFSQKALVEQEPILQHYVDKLIVNLKRMEKNNEEFNMVNWLNFTTFDIIGDLAFGDPFGCLDDGTFHAWVSLIYETVKAGALEQATRRFADAGTAFQNFLLWCLPSEIREKRRAHLRQSTEKVMRRLGKDTDHRDFIWYILKQKSKFDIAQDEIVVNAALFIVAGSETTANLLSGLIARLLRNADKFAKLKDEIRALRADELTYEKFKSLPYLNACLEEGLRIHPPVPTGLLRTVPKDGDFIDGQWVAGGTSVSVGSFAAAHNPVNFVDCDEFIPERWLDEGKERYARDIKKAMQPFSLGPRGCIGKHLSYMEMYLILGKIVWNFDIESTDGLPLWDPAGDMKNMRAFMTWEKPDLNTKVIAVKGQGKLH